MIEPSQTTTPTDQGGKNMTNMKVTFTANGLYETAYFDSVLALDTFARMMANDGSLYSVKVDGNDITENYLTFVTISDLNKRGG